MEIEVSQAELDEVQGWLDALSEAGNAEDGGAGEDVGSEEVNKSKTRPPKERKEHGKSIVKSLMPRVSCMLN